MKEILDDFMADTPQDLVNFDLSAYRFSLLKDEKILWGGQAKLFSSGSGCQAPFFIFWAGFAFLWEFLVIKFEAGLFFTLWGIPFVLVGIYLVTVRPLLAFYKWKTTKYLITNQRILALKGKKKEAIFPFKKLKLLPAVNAKKESEGRLMLSGKIADKDEIVELKINKNYMLLHEIVELMVEEEGTSEFGF